VLAGPLSLALTEASGPALASVEAGAVHKFKVVPKDSYGNIAVVPEKGVSGVLCSAHSPGKGDVQVDFVRNDDDTFTGLYTVALAGGYHLKVLIGDQPVKGSPFAVRSNILRGVKLNIFCN